MCTVIPDWPIPSQRGPTKTAQKTSRTFRQHIWIALFNKKKAKAMAKMEELVSVKARAAAERLKAGFGSYTSYDFPDVSIPVVWASIKALVHEGQYKLRIITTLLTEKR